MNSVLVQTRKVFAKTVTYVNHKGGTTSQKLCKLAITVWTWCTSQNITLTAEHLPGDLNVMADQESRLVRDRCDWMLNPHVFQKIQENMGLLEIDLFASHLTKQLPCFYSWRADPEAAATNEFMQDRSHLRGFVNPPGCLISCCLSKVKVEGARIVLHSYTTVEHTTLVSSSTGTVGGLPSPADQSTGFGTIASGSGVSHETVSSSTDHLAYLRQSYSSQGLSSVASDLMLAS